MEHQHDHLDGHVLIGKVIKAHGLKGEVRVYPYSGSPENFQYHKEVVLVAPAGNSQRNVLAESRSMNKIAILQLEGVTTRAGAEALRGYAVWVKKTDLPELAPDEYYWEDIKGVRAVADDGRELGVVVEIFNNRAHDILVIKGRGREYLVPMLADVVELRKESLPHVLLVSSQSGIVDLDE